MEVGIPILRCEWCASPAPAGDTRCAPCGGPVRVLEPRVLQCGWCGSSNRRDEMASCRGCGGVLPTIPGGDPGPRPPPAPRQLPAGYEGRVKLWKNVLVLLGVIFSVCFFWTLVFPIIGIPLWIVGAKKANRTIAALKYGVATSGRLREVRVDTSQHINGQHPWKIEFEYDTPDGVRTASVEAWDPSHADRVIGEHHWVVYVPGPDARVCAFWPPIL